MNASTTLLALVLTPIALAVGALLWGADTRDGFGSLEWKRREEWPV